jgi:hypothetical protein
MAKEVSLYVDEVIYKEFKKLCIDLDLSPSKQMTALINEFVDQQVYRIKRIEAAKKNKES